jgi:hypothetical protein
VVDPEMRVHGLQASRVADLDHADRGLRQHQRRCIMIGEKCAEMMLAARWAKGDWRRP